MPIKSVDLNLFLVFEAMMRHRSVAASARELNVTASAVSHALARLRQALADPLFAPSSEGMAPTPRALELAPTVKEGLGRLAEALDKGPFEPATSSRSFALAMSDYAATIVLPAIVKRLNRAAPNVGLRIFPLGRRDLVEHLNAGRLDMAFGWFASVPPQMGRMDTVIEGEALVVRAGHPLTQGKLTIERLFAFPHVVVELLGGGERPADGFVDEQGVERRVWIERLLLERENAAEGLMGRVAVSLPHYTSVATLVANSDMVATLPQRLAELEAARGAIALLKPPYESAPVTIEAIWAERAQRDAAVRWLVQEVAEATKLIPPLLPLGGG
jgi:DNA-binding transcriptional LysR family regulator